ncbi:MAG: hypothetical protein JWQ27_2707 [Ferruginibacter sp.]|nr:hypothetical protein [Ferruginibacter sp.]
MNYSTILLTTIADCDALLATAASEKDDLDIRKRQLERKQENAASNSTEIDADLASVTAEIEAYEAVIAGMPEGPAKQQLISKLTKAVYKKFTLEERRANYGVLAILQQQYTIACLEKDMLETDQFVAAVTVHKATL